ncbi:MAG: HIT family protein [Deltaproteobacteria bacterium]|nr:HIT family protein [Deltaproteobacteria bacterium]
MSCIFCKIIAGEIPSTRIYDDATTIAFMDINPGTRGHALVIPKEHAADIHDAPPEMLADLIKTAQRVAQAAKKELGCAGVNLVQSSGAAAFQSVFHIHIHVIPRYEGDGVRLPWTPKPGDKAEIAKTAEQLRTALG